MIGRVSSGAGFAGLQSYLLRGRNEQETDRVLWAATRGLPTDDP